MKEEKIKKLRELFDVSIEEISLVKFPATRKKFYIKKSDEQGLEKLLAAVADFVDDEFDIEKAASIEEFLEAMKTLKEYDLANVPDDVKDCMDTIVAFAVAGRGEAKEEDPDPDPDPDPDKGKKLKKADEWPSILLPDEAPFKAIEKKASEPITIDEFDELDEINESPETQILKKIDRYIDRSKVPEDPWPSIYSLTNKRPTPVIEKQADPGNGKGQKQSIDGQHDYQENHHIQKAADDDEDKWPSIPDEYFIKP